MAARHKARKRALDILYAADLRQESAATALVRATEQGIGPSNPYSTTVIEGVIAHQPEIDRILSRYSHGWTLDRMPPVDRNVLRIAVFEMLHADDVPDTVAIAEAMALVRELSTDDSATLVNGVLGAIQRDSATTAPDPGLA